VSEQIRVAVVGVGAFGRNHARVYHQLQQEGHPVELAGIVDANADRGAQVAKEFSTQHYRSISDLLARGSVHAASVAVPTVSHLEASRNLMLAGVDLLIEKPLAVDDKEAEELKTIADQHQRIVQVGHLERFNPAVRAAIPLLTHPMFFECHRLSVFTPRALDVDVVLDLMIHDLDIVLSFVGSPVKEVRAVGLPVLSPKVDIANVRVEFESGCVANFTASRVSTERVRKLRFFQPRQYISIDYGRQDLLVIDVDSAAVEEPSFLPSLAPPGIRVQKPPVQSGEPLKMEIQHFLESVRSRQKPVVSLEDGSRALSLALEINRTIADHHRSANLDAIAGVPRR